ncbi:hypothetical protein AGMMS50229_11560 [Campylobacterota bacterium]|nr:hypothetical protein AGMMS50229_11560 [Campylobacterota bacterium]
MIKKIVQIARGIEADDRVRLSWFDRQKPNLSAIGEGGVSFVANTAKFDHLHEDDILIAEDGYTIAVTITEDEIVEVHFTDALDFAKSAYEIGNRHQPICIESMKIIVLNDSALSDIFVELEQNPRITVMRKNGYFTPNVHRHSH